MDIKGRVAERLKLLRKRRGLTQELLAERIGRSVDAVSNLERGMSLPNFETLDRLASELGVPIRDFFDYGLDVDDPEREALLLHLVDTARSLKTSDLAIAVEQTAALARRQSD